MKRKKKTMPNDHELVSLFVDENGMNWEGDADKEWRTIQIHTQDMKPMYCDAFRKVRPTREYKIGKRVAFQPIIIFEVGDKRFGITKLSMFWRLTNEIIYPERLSFSDFKGILETFVPLTFFSDIIDNSQKIITLVIQENIKGAMVVDSVEPSTGMKFMGYEPLISYIASQIEPQALMGTKYVKGGKSIRKGCSMRNRQVILSWGRNEIELTEYANGFTMIPRYHALDGLVLQPEKPSEFKGAWDNVEAMILIDAVDNHLSSLNKLESLIKGFKDDVLRKIITKTGYPSTLTFKQRNELERYRYFQFISFLENPV